MNYDTSLSDVCILYILFVFIAGLRTRIEKKTYKEQMIHRNSQE